MGACTQTHSNMKESALSTPFLTFSSGVRYSFMRAGKMVKGEHVSATIAIATVVHTRFCRSCTFKLLRSVCKTSWGPIAFAMYPNVFTAARRIAFLRAFNRSRSSKQMRIHSRGETNSAPRSAMRPTRSMQFSCTFSCLFLSTGVRRGKSSEMDGCAGGSRVTRGRGGREACVLSRELEDSQRGAHRQSTAQ